MKKKAGTDSQTPKAKPQHAEKQRLKEATARRKVNKNWQKVESSNKYRAALARSLCRATTDRIADEVLDGIFLNLNERNRDKSSAEQKRLLRRIVEKRQAQAIHATTRSPRDRKSTVAIVTNTSKSMERIRRIRFAC